MPLGPITALVFGGLGWFLVRPGFGRATGDFTKWTALVLAGLMAALVALAAFMNTRVGYRTGVAFFYLGAGAVMASVRTARATRTPDPTALAMGLGALALCWSASISYGYQTPILGAGVLGVFLAGAAPRPWPRLLRPVAVAAALTVIALVAVHQVWHPYRESARPQHAGDLGTLYPRFCRLTTDAANLERYAEIKVLSERYARAAGRPFAVMPAFPLIYFLSDVRSPSSVDWYVPAIVNGREDRLLSELKRARALLLVERAMDQDFAEGESPPRCRELHASTPLVETVIRTGRLLHESRWFCVYDPPGVSP